MVGQTVSAKASKDADCQNRNEWFVHGFLSYAVVPKYIEDATGIVLLRHKL
jgi:hypothetical protein